LIDGGADLEVPDGSIGTPLANAVGYGCWHVARLLAARGARIGSMWEAAGLGDQTRVEEFLAGNPAPSRVDITGSPGTAQPRARPETRARSRTMVEKRR
jgi:hypothetical protein